MNPITLIVTALAAGAAAAASAGASQAIKDAYAGLAASIAAAYPQVNAAALEADPGSRELQAYVQKQLVEAGAGQDVHLLKQAQALLKSIQAQAPEVAGIIGVNLAGVIAAGDIHIHDVHIGDKIFQNYRLEVACINLIEGALCQGTFPLQALHRAREKGILRMRCQSCLEEIDVGQLLEGYDTPVEPFSQQLADLEAKLLVELAKSAIERQALQGIMAESAKMIRRVLRALTDQSSGGPRLFTLSPIDPTRPRDPRNLWSEELRLTLWCEHPGHEHPLTPEGQYILRNPKRWAAKLAPYAQLSLKVLRLAAPLADSAIGLAKEGVRYQWEDQFNFMEQLSKAATVVKPDIEALIDRIDHRHSAISRAEGAGLRAFHDLLIEVGWMGGATNLLRVRDISDESGIDILWVCPEHYKMYVPPDPVKLPEQS